MYDFLFSFSYPDNILDFNSSHGFVVHACLVICVVK